MTTHDDLAGAFEGSSGPRAVPDPLAEADLLYGEVEGDLRSTVRDLLRSRIDSAAQIRALDSPNPSDTALWAELATGVGLAGLLVPERWGGAGASAREAAVVLEELGRAVAAVPFLTSAVVATTALLAVGSSRAGGDLDETLHRLAAGEAIAALAVPLTTAPGGVWPTSVALEGERLRGAVTSVADGELADVVVVPVVRSGSPVLVLAHRPGAEALPRPSLDQTRRRSDVCFDQAPARVIAVGEPAVAAGAAALETGAGLLASEQLGVAEWCLDETVAYLKVRRQFGRPVGSFQALKHRLADVWLEITSLRAAARYAADRLARSGLMPDAETTLAVTVAQAYASGVAVHAAEEALQLHGGIGMTWEHPVHLRLKRAKADQLAFGTAGRHRSRLAGLVDLPAGEPS
ncbi:MAG: acyl-CoA dehydrogenase family protein [Kineosporiaceae bacterium]